MMSNSERSMYPFTPNQWQELEHQALIFKYMISGMQIPQDLLLSVKRNMDSHLSLSSRFFPHQSQYGWNCLQMGLGRKVDPEPGRCRRTDGKKWRCSKEAYPDSKYCERHMHRGKNRSRKPVEIVSTPNYKNTSSSLSSVHKSPSSIYATTGSSLSSISSTIPDTQNHHDHPCYNAHQNHPFYYQNFSSPRPSSGIGLSSQNNNTHLFLDSASYAQTEPDYRDRYVNQGLKEEIGEHLFFSEASGTMRSYSGSSMEDSCQLTPLTMSSNSLSHSSKQRNCSEIQSDYSCYLKLQSLNDTTQKMDRDNDEPQKTIHHFFDEWPLKNRDSWLNLDDNSSNCSSLSTTQLSISAPTSSHVFPIFNSRTHNDG